MGPSSSTSRHKTPVDRLFKCRHKQIKDDACHASNKNITICFHPLLMLAIILFFCDICQAQTFRKFPSLFNTAKLRPIVTEPSASSCGVPSRSAYCRSSTFSNSVNQCKQRFCVQDCPRRTSLPTPIALLVGSFGKCITTDTVNVRPRTTVGRFSTVFIPGLDTDCYITPIATPTLGANGRLTLTVWIWQEKGNNGTLVEKVDKNGKTIFRLRVSSSSILFTYRTAASTYDLEFTDNIASQTWVHLAIQVYTRSISYYVNGLRVGFTPAGTKTLQEKILDSNGQIRVGQTVSGTDQFIGRLQDFSFFSDILTNREIAEVYSGVFPEVYIQTKCRCPPSHPRVSPQHSRYCIKNGVPDNIGDEVLRLNNDSHPLQYINDGDSNSIWISAFMNDVNITIDLGDQFQVFYVVMQFYSPQPKKVTIQRRESKTTAWSPWQYYAEDCQQAYQMKNNGPLPKSTSVNCLQFGTGNNVIAYSKGNITFNILAGNPVARPGYNNFYNTPALFDFVKASQIKLGMQGHYYVTQERHEYYGLYEVIVTGRCNCYGHAEKCDTSVRPYKCACLAESNTVGDKCDSCKPLYNDKLFRPGDQLNAFNCKPCQCYNHASSCVYNASLDPFPSDHNRGGGGMCVDCAHNTEGRNCQKCKQFYFRAEGTSLSAVDVCKPCDCNAVGMTDANAECLRVGGQCPCKVYVGGRQCDTCKAGFYSLSATNVDGCVNCSCNVAGTVNADISCHATTGKCNCKRNVRERDCSACAYGYFNLDSSNNDGCSACNCNPIGSTNDFCNPSDGKCACKPNIQGRQCDTCAVGYYDFSSGCKTCSCNTQGSETSKGCNSTSGQCVCKPFTEGLICDQCQDGYHSLGSSPLMGCQACQCDAAGSNDTSRPCSKLTGKCECKENVQGTECNQCKGNTWGLSENSTLGCEPCDCDPTGTQRGDQVGVHELTCNQNSGQCSCLANRKGRRCDTCESGYYVSTVAGGGCLLCGCDVAGTIGGTTCDPQTGQCVCRGDGSGVGGLKCNSCLGNYHSFDPGTGRCSPCNCNEAGSLNDTCNPNTGQCSCKPFVIGDKCDSCMAGTSNLEENNPYGCSKAPSQQPPPKVENLDPNSLRLFWDAPDHPNGVILSYKLYREDKLIATLDPNVLEYNDTGLLPYTEYTYYIVATNAFGPVSSPTVTYRTLASVPTGMVILQSRDVGAQSVTLFWTRPNKTNGLITHYEVRGKLALETTFKQFWNGTALQVTLTRLGAFKNYTFQAFACTESGCLQSNRLLVSTLQTAPEKQGAPTITPLSDTSLFVKWDHPELPNGIIIFYELWMRGLPGPSGKREPEETRIFHPAGQFNPQPTLSPQENALPPPATNYTVTALNAYTVYEFQVLAENSAGKAASPWVSGRTLEALPLFMAAPTVIGVSSSQANVSWVAPAETQVRGQVISYNIYQYIQTDLSKTPFAPPYFWMMVRSVSGAQRSYIVDGLKPYSNYTFMLAVCNRVGCANSSSSSGRTLAAAPSGLSTPPSAEGYNSTVMAVSWLPPKQVNGPDPMYALERLTTAFNHPPPVVETGTRFPGGGYYLYPPETVPQGVAFTGFELEFKTRDSNGLLVFLASQGRQEEYVALQLKSGRPWFVFDTQGCLTAVTPNISSNANFTFSDGQWHRLVARRSETSGSIVVDGQFLGCPAFVTTTNDEGLPYNDGQWHTIKAVRLGKSGRLWLDTTWKGETTSTCSTGNIIGKNTGVYIGGIPRDYITYQNSADSRYIVERKSFRGCVKGVKILVQQTPEEVWKPLNWSSATNRDRSFPMQGCPYSLTNDTNGGILHFLGRGYAMMPLKNFTRTNEVRTFQIELKFRTDRKSGLILFVHGLQGHYLLSFINDSVLYVKFGYGSTLRGEVAISGEDFSLCDGQWWDLKLRRTIVPRKQITVQVKNSNSAGSTQTVAFESNVILSSNFYLGGIPVNSEASQFAVANDLGLLEDIGFGGCMQKFKVDFLAKRVFHEAFAEVYNVNTDGCPPDPTIAKTCMDVKPQNVYTGYNNQAQDYGLPPYTDFLYRVRAINNEGFAVGPWGIGRTKEGAPTGLLPPYDVEVISGYQIKAKWHKPTGHTGVITQFLLRAYNLDIPGESPVQVVYNNTDLTAGQIDDAVPFTNYSLKFVACTKGGCAESASAVTITTKEEAPDDVRPPVGQAGSTYILLSWQKPGRPNGISTGYLLFMDGRQVYSGNQQFYNVTSLKVYTSYTFVVRACTRVGCKDSPTVTVSTAQMPPTFMQKPKLTVLGTKRMRVDWQQPDQLNGQLERYLVYVSRTSVDIGQVAYNNSELFLNYVLEQLQAGTVYYIRVSACTGGGCRMSAPSVAVTAESAPEGVPLPNITATSSSQLLVTWDAPTSPNGIITDYKLYQNGLMVYNHSLVRQYAARNLQPWSLHTFRLEACTSRGCGSSNEVQARTLESPPEGHVVMEMTVDGPRTISVKWNAVAVPNGQVYYDVFLQGQYYNDPENWDYTTVQSRRSLYRSINSGVWIKVQGLIPHSMYQVQVNASNTMGHVTSNTLSANMPMGSPDGVKPPTLTSPTPTSVQAQWQAVGRANSDQQPTFFLQYRLKTPGALIIDLFPQGTTSTSYIKDRLQPHTEYEFRVTAGTTAYGKTVSEWASVITKQDKPSSIDPPMTSQVEARSLQLTWSPPFRPNGVLMAYNIYQNNAFRVKVAGNVTSMKLDSLTPNTLYIFKVEACTGGGCTMSPESRPVRTVQSAPEGLAAPTLTSTNPSSVNIAWSEPLKPNGVVISYRIERRVKGQTTVTNVQSFSPNAVKSYVDRSAALSPHTTYEYRVGAISNAGTGYSPWAEVTTKASRPGAMRPPTVKVLNATAIQVSWQEPINPNGQMERYLISLTNRQIEQRNVSVFSQLVTGLTPYTRYDVTVAACTNGGCTESTASTVYTLASVPEGQAPPTGNPVSQSIISLFWSPPTRPNGPNIRYELSRMKIRQPLDSSATGFGSWVSIYSGNKTFLDDRGLSLFTTYRYRVTVYNDYGQMTSASTPEVATFGGTPSTPPSFSVSVINHVSIKAEWQPPGVKELQGAVVKYDLKLTSGVLNVSKTYNASVTSSIVDELRPSTTYSAVLTLTINGGASITTGPKLVRTKDGAPSGLAAPQLFVVNDTALRVVWTVPTTPNGAVTAYNIYVYNTKIATGMTTAGSFVVGQLKPYTVYDIKIEVCTVFACTVSESTRGTTSESVPAEVSMPTLMVLGPYSISATWRSPGKPNGIIRKYEIWRSSKQPCSALPSPPSSPDSSKCSYIECGVLEGVCGATCYSGPKTCCNGKLFNNTVGYECCGDAYIPRRSRADDVCCNGRFYSRKENYTCCGGRYISVRAGEICCVDATQDRVDVGQGDRCCGSVPYSSSGAQVCCDGQLYNKFGQQCCGKKIQSSSLTCCRGNGQAEGQAYLTDVTKSCCGTEYASTATSKCCTDKQGNTKVHTYGSATLKASANDKCCGVERISAGLACCNTVSYNPSVQSCADTQGCGTGTICQGSSSSKVQCNRCDFNPASGRCSVVDRQIASITATKAPPTGTPGLCTQEPVRVYSGLLLTYTDTGLTPYTQYEYKLIVVNDAGRTSSPASSATTTQDKPEQVSPPVATVQPGRLDTIYLSWSPPTKPNGKISQYILLRGGLEIYRGVGVEFVDDNRIQPYQTYTYQLQACTVEGCTSSQQVTVSTLQAKPEQVFAVNVVNVSSTSLQVSWLTPGKPNGIITLYSVTETTTGRVANTTGAVRQYLFTGLQAYTEYEFVLSACTEAGCTSSTAVKARTAAAAPQGIASPRVVIISSNVADIFWRKPTQPNGIITGYRVYRYLQDDTYTLVFSGGLNDLSVTDSGLKPSTQYSYLVEVTNSAGATRSPRTTVTSPTTTPLSIPAPKVVRALSSSVVTVEWDAPATPNGQIDQYRVLLNPGMENELVKSVGLATATNVTGLLPFMNYRVRIQACLKGVSNGCGTGPAVSVTTLEAPPQNQPMPVLKAISAAVVEVSWQPPTNPNGVMTAYRLFRRIFGGQSSGVLVTVMSPPGPTLAYKDVGLQSFTEYEYYVLALNKQGQISSAWARVRTLEAVPQNVSSVSVTVTSAYGLLVSWQAPGAPNGIITKYQVQYRPISTDPTTQYPVKSVTVAGNVLSTSVSGLQPYTRYQVRVTAVNSAGPTSGAWTEVMTKQASPADIGDFTVEKITDGRAVILRWNSPKRPNGIIDNYHIYEEGNLKPVYSGLSREFEFRRLLPATAYTVQLEACTVSGCSRGKKQTIMTIEIPPKDQLPPTMGGVNSTYVVIRWKKPLSSNGKLLSFEVIRRSETRITKRDTTEPVVVFKTTNTTRDNYEYVDRNLKPYTKYSYKIRASNAMGSAESDWVDVETLQGAPEGLNPPIIAYFGSSYDMLKITWNAPQFANGIIQSYELRRNDSVPFSFTPKNPFEYIDRGLMAYTYYSYTVSACTAAVLNRCTTSRPAQILTRESAPLAMARPEVEKVDSTSLKITWSPPQITNGRIRIYHVKVDNVTVYSGLLLEFVKTDLTPYQAYKIMVTACTNGGCTDSPDVTARPFEDAPTGLFPPKLTVTSATSIEIKWDPPTKPNGIITSYELRRNGSLIESRSTATTYTDNLVKPGTRYVYTVTAYNSKGSVTSQPESVTTYSSSPTGVSPPALKALSSTEIEVTWSVPTEPNGAIVNYTLYTNDNFQKHFGPTSRSYIVQYLKIFTSFSFKIQACTDKGCALSQPSVTSTLEAPPVGQNPPHLEVPTKSGALVVTVTWSSPDQPNGLILKYELYRRNSSGLSLDDLGGSRILLYSGNATKYEDTSKLEPYADYEYLVVVYNSKGSTSSKWAKVTSQQAAPHGLTAPIVKASTTTTLTIEMPKVSNMNGKFVKYTIYLNKQPVLHTKYNPVILGDISTALSPNTEYEVSVDVCTEGGCTRSPAVKAQTQGTSPAGLSPPVITQVTSSSIHLQWAPPYQWSKIVQRYEVLMRSSCFNQPITDKCTTDDPVVTRVGLNLSHSLTGLKEDHVYDLMVRAYHEEDSITSPWITNRTLSSATPLPPAASSVMFYQEVWFIVLVAICILLLLFICLAFCLRSIGPRSPYIRERMPLQPKQKKPGEFPYTIDAFDRGIISTEIPKGGAPMNQNTLGYVNPAFTQMSGLPAISHQDSMLDYNYDRMSQKSSKLLGDEYDDPLWDTHLPNDSGLHSYAPYDDDYDNQSSRPYSIVKEHVMFTDTHL